MIQILDSMQCTSCEEYQFHNCVLREKKADIHGCCGRRTQGMFHGTLQIPVHGSPKEPENHQKKEHIPLLGQGHSFHKLSFYIYAGDLLLLDYDEVVQDMIERKEHLIQDTTAETLYGIMTGIVEQDFMMLDDMYRQLAALEDEIPRDNSRFFLQRMSTMKQAIYQMFRYYNQLSELLQELADCKDRDIIQEDMTIFERIEKRISRLCQDTQVLREYAMEIWEIYQSQINIRQNDIMKVLTIVTTIFLPLTLIAGWYGMNFQYMPEIGWRYGYPTAIGLSLGVVILCMIIFKKKKYW